MSTEKNFDILEVGCWYRTRNGSIGKCIGKSPTNLTYSHKVIINGQLRLYRIDGLYGLPNLTAQCEHDLDIIEKVANQKGDPWMPVEFKVGDTVRVKEDFNIDRYIRNGITSESQRNDKKTSSKFDATVRNFSGGVYDCMHSDGYAFNWYPDDLILVKSVNDNQVDSQNQKLACIGRKHITCVNTKKNELLINSKSICHIEEIDTLIDCLKLLRDSIRNE